MVSDGVPGTGVQLIVSVVGVLPLKWTSCGGCTTDDAAVVVVAGAAGTTAVVVVVAGAAVGAEVGA